MRLCKKMFMVAMCFAILLSFCCSFACAETTGEPEESAQQVPAGSETAEEAPADDPESRAIQFVYHCYQAALGREPENMDAVDNYCRMLMSQEKSMEDILFLFSQAAGIERPDLSDEEYVQMLYRTMLGREMSNEELSGRADQLRTGSISREQMALNIIWSPECAGYLDQYRLTEVERARYGGSRLAVYEEATKLMQSGDYQGACQKFKSIPGFMDSDTLADRCGTAAFCEKALSKIGGIQPPAAVRRTYEAIYHMFGIEESERLNWAWSISNWTSISTVVESFIGYSAFNDPSISNAERVKALFSIMLGRVVDPTTDDDGSSNYRRYLDAGMSARAVANAISTGDEYMAFCQNNGESGGVVEVTENRDKDYQLTAIISRCYETGLHRSAMPEELNHWCDVYWNDEQHITTVISNLLCSDEAIGNMNNENFVRTLYRVATYQEVSDAEVREWIGQLAGGLVNRWQVASIVLTSEAARVYLSSLGLQGPW